MHVGYWFQTCLKHTNHVKSTEILEWEWKTFIQITGCTMLGNLTGKWSKFTQKSMQLARHMSTSLKYPLGPKVALDFRYNFILSMTIFLLSGAMAIMAMVKFELSNELLTYETYCIIWHEQDTVYLELSDNVVNFHIILWPVCGSNRRSHSQSSKELLLAWGIQIVTVRMLPLHWMPWDWTEYCGDLQYVLLEILNRILGLS